MTTPRPTHTSAPRARRHRAIAFILSAAQGTLDALAHAYMVAHGLGDHDGDESDEEDEPGAATHTVLPVIVDHDTYMYIASPRGTVYQVPLVAGTKIHMSPHDSGPAFADFPCTHRFDLEDDDDDSDDSDDDSDDGDIEFN